MHDAIDGILMCECKFVRIDVAETQSSRGANL
jgi:hypothetical protein